MSVESNLLPDNETERIAAVQRYEILDTPPDGAFERITRLAARHFGVPVSIVSIVDSDRIWFKSHHGVDVAEIGRDPGLCASAILGDGTWVIENAEVDPRAMANPLVAGEMGLRFYAGAPLKTGDGFNLGTLCVIDQSPREFSGEDVEVLTEMAEVVVDELELRLAARRTVSRETALRQQAERLARELQLSLLPATLPEVDEAEMASLYTPADEGVVGGDFFDAFTIDGRLALVVGDVSGKGPGAAAVTGLVRHSIRSAALWFARPAEIMTNLNRAMLLDRHGNQVEHYCTVLLVLAERRGRSFRLVIAGAGHPPGLLLHAGAEPRELTASGPPVGWYEDPSYEETVVEMGAGDGLLLYTDGLTEARRGGRMLGIETLRSAIPSAASAHGVIEALRDMLAAPETIVTDDVAALVFKARS